jgi:thiol-disulfide isomerase/thioredoxin/outer membrane lipoprotein-sorting protein
MFGFAASTAAAVLFSAAVCAGTFAQDEVAGPDPKVDTKAGEVVKKMIEHYGDLPAVSCKIDLAISVKGGGEEMGGDQDIKGAYTFAAEKPNHAAMRLTEGDFGLTVVSDGESLYTYSPNDDMYMKAEAPDDIAALRDEVAMTTNISQASEEGRFLLGLMTDEGYEHIMEGVTELAWVGEEKVGEEPANRVKLVRQDRLDLDLLIASNGKPWLLRIVPDVQKMASAMGDPRTINIAATLSDWSTDIAPDTFTFNAPESAMLFDPNEEQLDGTTLVDKPAPELTLSKLGSESEINLADHKGKDIVVLDFWATWCPPCVKGLPILNEVTKEYADRNVVFYAVDLRETPEEVQKFMAKKSWDFTVLMDSKGKVARSFGVGPIPHSVIISKDGIIEAVHVGIPEDLEELRTRLKGELDTLIADGKL